MAIPKFIEERIREEFPPSNQEAAIKIVSNCCHDDGYVLNVALNTVKGDVTELKSLLSNADYRDILISERSPREVFQSKIIIYGAILCIFSYSFIAWLNEQT
jgi:hypothetical protein